MEDEPTPEEAAAQAAAKADLPEGGTAVNDHDERRRAESMQQVEELRRLAIDKCWEVTEDSGGAPYGFTATLTGPARAHPDSTGGMFTVTVGIAPDGTLTAVQTRTPDGIFPADEIGRWLSESPYGRWI